MRNSGLELAAETHLLVRPELVKALTNFKLSPEVEAMFPGCSTYLDLWKSRFGDRFFDMGTLIRAAAGVETGLRDYYAEKKGYTNLSLLRADPKWKQNIFKRILPWSKDGAIPLLKSVGVDLTAIPQLPKVQELMLHRQLYAHNLGVIDDQYIMYLKKLTGKDLLAEQSITDSYPDQDKVWLEPLTRTGAFLTAARGLFSVLP